MSSPPRIALIGDRSPDVRAHLAIPGALEHASRALGMRVLHEWVHSAELAGSAGGPGGLRGGVCGPGGPYASMEGALRGIRHARESGTPFLGTCGGFQHALIEFARGVLGIRDAEHAETSPEAERLVISPLSCSLVGKTGTIRFAEGTRLAR